MGLQQTIEQDFITAMRDKNEVSMAVLRMLKSAVINKKIEKKLPKSEELPELEVIAVIKSEVKKRKDSFASYQQADRIDLAQREDQEIKILEQYLPTQLAEEKIKKIITAVVQETGISDFGQVMGAVMAKTAGQADGQVVSRLVKEILIK